MSSIYFEKERGKYRAAFITPAGKRVTKRFKTKEEAEDWVSVSRMQVRNGSFIEPNNIPIGEWILKYLELYKKNVKPSTFTDYLIVAKILEPLSKLPLNADNTMLFQEYFNNLALRYSQNTILKIKNFLSESMNRAVFLGLANKNCVKGVVLAPIVKTPVESFTKEKIQKIIQASKKEKLYPLIMLAIFTGMRIGEICALKWIDYDGKYIHVRRTISGQKLGSTTKTQSSTRDVILPDNIIAILNKMPHDCEFIFHSRSGHFYFYRHIHNVWVRVLKRAGLPYKKFHALRHTHASQLIAAGVPVTEVAKRLGHSNVGTTLNVYSHAIKGSDEKVSKVVENVFCPQSAPNS